MTCGGERVVSRQSAEKAARQAAWTEALRRVRGARNLRTAETARLMGMELRTYERLEAGETQIEVEKLFQFADATDCDPVALFCSVYLADPSLATVCRDSKLGSLQAIILARLLKRAATAAGQIDSASFVAAMEAAADELLKDLAARHRFTSSLLRRPRRRRNPRT